MKKGRLFYSIAGLGALLALLIPTDEAAAMPTNGGDAVQSFYEALLSAMKNGPTLGQTGRFAQLQPIIQRTFDIHAMTQLSVGFYWTGLTDAQRQQVTESFGRYIAATYADRFDNYTGQRLEVTGEQSAATGLMVRSQIVKANGEPVNLDYVMHPSGDGWRIADIYLDGAISEVATRRSEFSSILKREGV